MRKQIVIATVAGALVAGVGVMWAHRHSAQPAMYRWRFHLAVALGKLLY